MYLNAFNDKTRNYILLGLIVGVGALFRLINLDYGAGTHPDERFMISVVQRLLERFSAGQELNPGSFAYGSLSYYCVWALSGLIGLFWPEARYYDGLFLVARGFCVFAGLSAVVLTYAVARKVLRSDLAALLAAALLSVNFLHVQLSRYFTSDIPLTTLVLIALFGMLRILEGGGLRWFALTGAVTGLALATKISALILAAPLGFTLLLTALKLDRAALLRAGLAALVIALCAALAFMAAEPYALLDFHTFIKDTTEQTSMARGITPLPYTVQYHDTTPYLYHLRQIFSYTTGWPVSLAAGAGLLLLIVRSIRNKRWQDLLLPVWVLSFFFATAGMQVKFPRYLLPIYPPLMIFAALAVSWLFEGRRVTEAGAPAGRAAMRPGTAAPLTLLRKALAPGLGLLALGGLLSAVTLRAQPAAFNVTLWSWLISIGAMLLLLYLLDCLRGSQKVAAQAWGKGEATAFLLIFSAALTVRLTGLDRLPFELQSDEMNFGLWTRRFLSDQPPLLFSAGWLGAANPGYFLNSALMGLFGGQLFGLRMAALVPSLFSLAALFMLLRLLFNSRTAVIATTLAAFYHFHVHFSRIGNNVMPALALALWALYLFVLGTSRRSLLLKGAAGVLTALACLENDLAWAFLPVLAAAALLDLRENRNRGKELWPGCSAFLLSALATAAPMIGCYLQSPGGFLARLRQLYVFSSTNAAHMSSVAGSADFQAVLRHQVSQLAAFFTGGRDMSPLYGFQGMFIDPAIYLFFLAGLLVCLLKPWRKGGLLLWTWLLAVTICGGLLLIDTPSSPRLLGLSLLIPVFPAVALDALSALLEKHLPAPGRRLALLIPALIVLLSAWWNFENYFSKHNSARPGTALDQVSRLVARNTDVKTVISLLDPPLNFNAETFAFMCPAVKGLSLRDESMLPGLLQEVARTDSPAMVLAPAGEPLLGMLAPLIKTNRIGLVKGRHGMTGFSWYVVP